MRRGERGDIRAVDPVPAGELGQERRSPRGIRLEAHDDLVAIAFGGDADVERPALRIGERKQRGRDHFPQRAPGDLRVARVRVGRALDSAQRPVVADEARELRQRCIYGGRRPIVRPQPFDQHGAGRGGGLHVGHHLSDRGGELRRVGAGIGQPYGEFTRELQGLQFAHHAVTQSGSEPTQDREADRIDIRSVHVAHRSNSLPCPRPALAPRGAEARA